MKYIILIGKTVHFQTKKQETACGLVGVVHTSAWDPRDVECERCKKTKAYRATMGVK